MSWVTRTTAIVAITAHAAASPKITAGVWQVGRQPVLISLGSTMPLPIGVGARSVRHQQLPGGRTDLSVDRQAVRLLEGAHGDRASSGRSSRRRRGLDRRSSGVAPGRDGRRRRCRRSRGGSRCAPCTTDTPAGCPGGEGRAMTQVPRWSSPGSLWSPPNRSPASRSVPQRRPVPYGSLTGRGTLGGFSRRTGAPDGDDDAAGDDGQRRGSHGEDAVEAVTPSVDGDDRRSRSATTVASGAVVLRRSTSAAAAASTVDPNWRNRRWRSGFMIGAPGACAAGGCRGEGGSSTSKPECRGCRRLRRSDSRGHEPTSRPPAGRA